MSQHSSTSGKPKRQSTSQEQQHRTSLFIDEGVIEPPHLGSSTDQGGSGLSVIIDDTRMDTISTGSIHTSGFGTPEGSSNNSSGSARPNDPTIKPDLALIEPPHGHSSPLVNKSIQHHPGNNLPTRDDSSANTVSTSALGGDTGDLTHNTATNPNIPEGPVGESSISLDPMVLNDFDALLESTPVHHISDRPERHSKALSSLFQYDDTIEPDIEEAVELLKREMRVDSARITRITEGELEAVPDAEVSRQSIEFKPQSFRLMSKSSVITEPPPSPGISHAPRSPSLINKFIINKVIEEDGVQGDNVDHFRDSGFDPKTFLALASSETHSNMTNKNVNRLSGGIPKIPVLRRVSGPSKWARTTSMTDTAGVTPHKVSTTSPLSKTNQPAMHTDANATSHGTQLEFNRLSGSVAQPIPEMHSLASPAETVAHHHNSIRNHNNNIQEPSAALSEHSRLMSPPQQRLNNNSVESFDSQELKFKDIYSLQRVLLTIAVCIVCPAAFFMIGVGSRAGVNDYRLMRMILNREHRIGLLKGFIWDIRVNWFRHLCLVLGLFELMAIGVCIGVGFGVGLRNERH